MTDTRQLPPFCKRFPLLPSNKRTTAQIDRGPIRKRIRYAFRQTSALSRAQYAPTLCLECPQRRQSFELIAAVMGMRRGEIFGLKWGDIDFDRAVLHVRRSYVDGVEGLPKTESSRRPLPLPAQVMEALKTWKDQTPFSHVDDWVFASETGCLLRSSTSASNHSGRARSGVGMSSLPSKRQRSTSPS